MYREEKRPPPPSAVALVIAVMAAVALLVSGEVDSLRETGAVRAAAGNIFRVAAALLRAAAAVEAEAVPTKLGPDLDPDPEHDNAAICLAAVATVAALYRPYSLEGAATTGLAATDRSIALACCCSLKALLAASGLAAATAPRPAMDVDWS